MRTFRVVITALVAMSALAACTLLPPHETDRESPDAERTSAPAQEPARDRASPQESVPGPVVATLAPAHAPARIRRRMAELIADTVDPLPSSETGYYMDLQEANLRKALQGGGIGIVRRDNRIVLILAGEQGFATGETRLSATADEALARVARVLTQYPETFLAIHGYTDPAGEKVYNQRLSTQRSLSVARQLIAGGIASRRMVAVGHGESDAETTDASSPHGRPSRRIELHLLPLAR